MPASNRLKLVDSVKGIAIVLVVYGHVAQGVHHRGWWDSPNYLFQEKFIYSFHMAAFFFVSGLFVQGSIAKTGPGQFVLQRMRTVLWPYLTCVLSGIAESLFGQKGGGQDLLHWFFISVVTGEASWFLPTLFLCLLLSLATNRLPAWARFGLALTLALIWPANGVWSIIDRVARFFVFLTAGEWVGMRIERFASSSRWLLLVASAIMFALVGAGCLGDANETRSMGILLGLSGVLGLFCLSAGLRSTAFETGAVWCGVASLGIFVLHPFLQGSMRLILARVSASHAVLPNLLIPSIVAIIGSGLLWHFRERLRIDFLFECPWGVPRRGALGGGTGSSDAALNLPRGAQK
jgi:fucose 4-O-acetylase-like acetyltransferase